MGAEQQPAGCTCPGGDEMSCGLPDCRAFSAADQAPKGPPVIEGPGRYVVYEAPDGGWIVARAVELCETCLHCGCGVQSEPITVPGLVIKMAMKQGGGKVLSMLKGMKR